MIARVEPLTTTRRLSGPFDYRVEGRWRSARSCACRSATRSSTGSSSASPTRRRSRTRSWSTSPSRARGLDPARPRRPRAVDGRGVLLDARAGAGARHAAAREGQDGFWAEPTGADGRAQRQPGALLARLPGPAGDDLAALRRLEKRGLVAITERGARRAPRTNPAPDRTVELTEAQTDALAAIEAAPGAAHLLHGVTGSGKTEVYLRAAAAALERGEGVIALVPEIALTPQTVARFAGALRRHGRAAALRALRGRALRRVAAAAHRRGADRRRPALRGVRPGRAARADRRRRGARQPPTSTRATRATTPATSPPTAPTSPARGCWPAPRRRGPETVHTGCTAPAAAARGRRRGGRPAARARARHARRPALAAPRDAARARRRAQVDRAAQPPRLVELPHLPSPAGRRGSARNCDVALVLHRAEHALACHHCGHRERVPDRCDACGSLAVARHGAGTERVEDELRARARRARLPARRRHRRPTRTPSPSCSRASAPRPTGLLLGTQMVAKGHDFPDVTLGVVLDADSTLRFPDFRAEERTFALIAQLAGRAGRGPQRRARARPDHARPTRPRSSPPPATTPTASCAGSSSAARALRLPAVRAT